MNELALFAGAGGGILGGKLLGWRTVCAVERDAYAAQILAQRQNDGILAPFPIWSDVCSFDGTRWRGLVNVISGGFPCQDISIAGKGSGLDGERSGLWREMARIIGEVRPRYAFIENSPMLVSRGLDVVLGDLAKLGFDARWGVLSAAAVGAPHKRERIWIVAHSNNAGQRANQGRRSCGTRAQSRNNFSGLGEAVDNTISLGRDSRGNDNGEHDGNVTESTSEHAEVLAYPNALRSAAGLTDSQGGQEGYAGKSNDCRDDLANTDSTNLEGGGDAMTRKDGKSRSDMLDWAVEYQTGGRLNPQWVEWLMGWPVGWTDLKPLETDKSQSVQLTHSDSYMEVFE